MKRNIASIALIIALLTSGAAAATAPEVDASVERGLDFLAKLQRPDGAISDGPNPVAMTGLSLLAYLSAGHTPDAGRHGIVVRSAIECLLKSVPDDGYVGSVDGSRMYGQGIVALALAEAYGVENDAQRRKKIRLTLTRMIGVILKAQQAPKSAEFAGGWRYEPGSNDSDLSLSGWSALSLRAAQNVGLNVPKEPIEKAVGFVLKTFKDDEGAFAYQPGQTPTIAMTSVAVLNLHMLDAADKQQVKRATEWLLKKPIKSDERFFHYAIYYSTQASRQVGGALGDQAWANNRKLLLERQQPDGGFAPSPTREEPGRAYATAMSVLTLAVPFEMLPIYQK
jgi:hypothetical protein